LGLVAAKQFVKIVFFAIGVIAIFDDVKDPGDPRLEERLCRRKIGGAKGVTVVEDLGADGVVPEGKTPGVQQEQGDSGAVWVSEGV
jgi:hypothetical protein